MLRRVVFHPFCFGIFPALSLISVNMDRMLVDNLALSAAGLSLVASAVLFFALRLVMRDWQRAGLLASAWVALFFSYGSLARGGAAVLPARFGPIWERAALPPLWLVMVVVVGVALFRTRRDLARATHVANATALVLVLLPLLQIGRMTLVRARYWQALAATRVGVPVAHALGVDHLPDIYYIILDRYASGASLREFFGFDNTPFLSYLRAQGFYVADDSFDDYTRTPLSLASSLNLCYLDDLVRLVGKDSRDWGAVQRMLDERSCERILHQHGYRTANVGSRFEMTMEDKKADENYPCCAKISMPFASAFLGHTPVLPEGVGANGSDVRYRQFMTTKQQFHVLEHLPPSPCPRFVFAHILCPHDPYVFSADGSFVSPAVAEARPEAVNYVEQVRFVNTAIEHLLGVLMKDKKNPPVILIQADEGPYPQGLKGDDPRIDWWKATPAQWRMKTAILNAYYLPGKEPTHLYPSITPVNSLRVVFNRYLHSALPLLPDRVYGIRNNARPFDFRDITEIVRGQRE